MKQHSAVARILLLAISLFVATGFGEVAKATPQIVLANSIPMVDPTTNLSASAGLPGDIILFSLPETSTSATVAFTGASPVSATLISTAAGFTNFSVVVPIGTQTGPVSITSQPSGITFNAGIFQVWSARGEPYVMPAGHLNVTLDDLKYILDQIKMSEAHSVRTSLASGLALGTSSSTIKYPYDVTSANRCFQAIDLTHAASATYGPTGLSNQYIWTAEDPLGLRQVDGQCNNISNVTAEPSATSVSNGDTAAYGSADHEFMRLEPRATGSGNPNRAKYDSPLASVSDSSPRVISNLISDQTTANPAAVAAASEAVQVLYGAGGYTSEWSVNATTGAPVETLDIPNITPDYNVSAGYNSWFTLFGQFFDHGLDLVPKAGAAVVIPLQPDDPLYVEGAPNMMVLTRAANASGESLNITTPWVDQSQTYGSHPSQNFFLREYSVIPSGSNVTIKSTGRLLDNSSWNSGKPTGMPTWNTVKNQAAHLGITLTDYDAESIPVIASDQYGKMIAGPHGYPLVFFHSASTNKYVWIEASAAGLGTGRDGNNPLPALNSASDWIAVDSGHPFINDTAASAVPYKSGQCPGGPGLLTPDSDSIINNAQAAPSCSTYDDELFNAHLIAGDGRINENIALSAVHNIFHSEHNLLVQDIENLISNDPVVTSAFRSEWKDLSGNWNGERIFQAARFVNEMEYQHMVFDEFARRIAPELPVFLTYNPNANAQISAEFASAVYRLGHSMLNETIARSTPGTYYSPTANQDVSLINAFTNPVQALMNRPAVIASAAYSTDIAHGSNGSIKYTLSSGEVAPHVGAIVSISNMADSHYNVVDAVVEAADSTSFTIASYYNGGSTPITLDGSLFSAPHNSSASKNLPNGSTPYAAVSVSDPGSGNSFDFTPLEATAAVAQGMASQRGNEIDEFVTDGVRNNLLGLPLDLASLNIARGRDVGLPSLNEFRSLNSTALRPYTSWYDYITTGLRHRDSGVNFIAAYGQDDSIKNAAGVAAKRTAALNITTRAIPVLISGADSRTLAGSVTYTGENTYSVGQHVTVSGIVGSGNSGCNITNGVVSAADPSSFAITSANSCTKYVSPSATTSGSGGQAIYVPQGSADVTTTNNAIDFVSSRGYWSTHESGLNYVDLWIGGLAENPNKQPVIPPMLGSTFQYVFLDQMQKLQDSDRFYYLSRLIGINLFGEIPGQKLTDIVRRNTPSAFSNNSVTNRGIVGLNTPGFSFADCAMNSGTNVVPDALVCKATTSALAPFVLSNTDLTNVVLFADPNSASATSLQGGGGDDSVQGGPGNDRLAGGIGGDVMVGGAGNDVMSGGPGEDIMNGNSGDDSINAGTSQLGDIADGGSGNDFIHCGNCSGLVVSFNGESGNDFVQGGKSSDLAITGGEGNDWLEGGAGADIMNGDSGPFANINLGGISQISGGADIINPGTGLDLASGDGGDDIFLLGMGTATADGGFGFDWSDNEYATRYDNGPGLRPNVWADLGGNLNPNTARTGDNVVNVEALSGSAGNDLLFGGTGRMPITVTASGVAGNNFITITGAQNVLPGSFVSGSSNAGSYFLPNTVITDIPVVLTAGAMTYHLSSAVQASFTRAQITLTIDPLTAPGMINGLTQLISGTAGTSQPANNGAAWSNGAIILGGEGNDSLFPSDGSDIIHGSAYLHACIQVLGNVSSAVSAAMDVPCGNGRGFSSMSLVAPFMDSGVVSASSLNSVREILPSSVPVTSITASGSAITYTAANNFYVGEAVTVAGLVSTVDLSPYWLNNAVITARTSTTFTVTSSAPALSSTSVSDGRAVATDTLDLSGGVTAGVGQAPAPLGGISGPRSQFTIAKWSGALPAGAMYGCTVTDNGTGNVITAFDIEFIKFTGRTNALLDVSSTCGPTAIGIPVTVPNSPDAPTVTLNGNTATVNWIAPTSNGGSRIDVYKIQMYDTSTVTPVTIRTGTCSSLFNTSTNGGITPIPLTCQATGLTLGMHVQFTVQAHNVAGYGAESAKSSAVTPQSISNGGNGGGGNGGGGNGGGGNGGGGSPSGSLSLLSSPTSPSGSYGLLSKVTLTVVGGGDATFVVTSQNQAGCAIHGNVVTANGVGACTINAASVGNVNITGTITLTFTAIDQSPLRITNTNLTATAPSSFKIQLSGGSGSGAITYSATNNGGTNSCVVSGSGSISSATSGTCTVTATKAGSAIFNSATSAPVTFTFRASN